MRYCVNKSTWIMGRFCNIGQKINIKEHQASYFVAKGFIKAIAIFEEKVLLQKKTSNNKHLIKKDKS